MLGSARGHEAEHHLQPGPRAAEHCIDLPAPLTFRRQRQVHHLRGFRQPGQMLVQITRHPADGERGLENSVTASNPSIVGAQQRRGRRHESTVQQGHQHLRRGCECAGRRVRSGRGVRLIENLSGHGAQRMSIRSLRGHIATLAGSELAQPHLRDGVVGAFGEHQIGSTPGGQDVLDQIRLVDLLQNSPAKRTASCSVSFAKRTKNESGSANAVCRKLRKRSVYQRLMSGSRHRRRSRNRRNR